MENELKTIKNILLAIAIIMGFQLVGQSCGTTNMNHELERIANKMPSPEESLKNINTTLDYRLLKLQDRCSK